MALSIFRALRRLATSAALCMAAGAGLAEPRHGIAMYGEPALPPGFRSLPYADPDAPKGGRIVVGEVGSFDSLNPHILKGTVPWQLRFLGYESLMGRNYDEPFGLYGLLAESIEVPEDRSWAEFTLREEARFSDGTKVTVEDVMWSYRTLGTIGHPRYLNTWNQIERMQATGPRSVRFEFSTENRELALVVGLVPILKKAQWDDRDFAASGLDTPPIATAPYTITDYEAGRFVEMTRDPDYWGRDLPFMAGQANLDTIRMEFYADQQVLFEAFKAGQVTSIRETNAEKWATQYDFPAVTRGDVTLSEIPHQRPSGITGLVMNTRRPLFSDWRVRSAMIHAFNFEFINETMTGGRQERITSYFSNSPLAMNDGPADEDVRALLMPYADSLVPDALEAYSLPKGDGSARNRANLRRAMALMDEAGYSVEDGRMIAPDGTPVRFEILLPLSTPEADVGTIVDLYVPALDRMGIAVDVTRVERAQFVERTDAFDFDMTFYTRGLSLSPGNEQKLYWSSAAASSQGSLNWMGVQSPAIDAMIDEILTARTRDGFVTATRALDRILTTGRYVIPFYQNTESRIAHDADLTYPEDVPLYGDFLGFHPDVWWSDAAR